MINTALLAGYDRHGAVGGPIKRFFGGGIPLQKISDEGFTETRVTYGKRSLLTRVVTAITFQLMRYG